MYANMLTCGMTSNLLLRLRAGVHRAKSQRAYAKALGISPAYLNDLLHGRRKVSATIARKLGFVRETTYREANRADR